MLKKTVVSLFAAALVLAGCSSAPEATPITPNGTLEPFYSQTLSWDKCKQYLYCTEVTVPLDYNDLDGPTIKLALMKHPAQNQSEKVGSLLVNPGGPGGSGVDYVEAYGSQFTDVLIEKFDLVGWDPRGVGDSAAVECLTDAELDEYIASDPTPDNAAELAEFNKLDAQYTSSCLEKTGDLLSHVSTVETAKDLDILRAVLGDEQLYYMGKSYGTQLGAVYAHLFPENVGRLVLDGAVDVRLPSAELALGQARAFEVAIQRFARYCTDYAVVCSLGKTPEQVVDFIFDYINDLDQNPQLIKESGRMFTESHAWSALFGPMYVPNGGWDWLIEAFESARKGNAAGLMEISDWINGRDLDGTYMDNSGEAFPAISCLDYGREGETSEELLPRYEAEAPLIGRVFAWSEGCQTWPVQGEISPTDVAAPTANPILVVGTRFDPATPFEWSPALAENLQVGRLLIYEGDGHTAYMSGSECIDKIVDAYLIDGTLPADGKSCQPDFAMLD